MRAGEWLIVQYNGDAKAKAIAARLQYDTANCVACNSPEWIRKCACLKKQGGKK